MELGIVCAPAARVEGPYNFQGIRETSQKGISLVVRLN